MIKLSTKCVVYLLIPQLQGTGAESGVSGFLLEVSGVSGAEGGTLEDNLTRNFLI